VPGAIHEAHEGVLFIDELPHLGHLQRFILTAMQERRFPISGRNPQSAGASVKVDNVPCSFIFVGACNIQDLEQVLSPLRSRVCGNGYEVLVNTAMPDTEENRGQLLQFIAQEIVSDGRIPHADASAIEAVIRGQGGGAQQERGGADQGPLRLLHQGAGDGHILGAEGEITLLLLERDQGLHVPLEIP
jgi:ATP-dependent Lon protease